MFDTINKLIGFARTKWGHAIFATAAFGAPLFFQAAGVAEPSYLQPLLNLAAAGTLTVGAASYLDILKAL